MQRLKALTVTSEDLVSGPTWQLATLCNSSSRGADAYFWPLQVPGTHVVRHACIPTNEHVYKIKHIYNKNK